MGGNGGGGGTEVSDSVLNLLLSDVAVEEGNGFDGDTKSKLERRYPPGDGEGWDRLNIVDDPLLPPLFLLVIVGVAAGDAIKFDMESDFAMSLLLISNCILR